MRNTLAAAILVTASLALTGCATHAAATPTTPLLLTAIHHCNLITTNDGITYADHGGSLILSTDHWTQDSADYPGTLTDQQALCIVRAAGAPAAAIGQIQQTRELDGMQRDSWNTVKASWTYASTTGLDITLQDTSVK